MAKRVRATEDEFKRRGGDFWQRRTLARLLEGGRCIVLYTVTGSRKLGFFYTWPRRVREVAWRGIVESGFIVIYAQAALL